MGLALWYVPYLLPRLVVRVLPVTQDSVATYKLASAVVLFPLAYLAWILAAGWYAGPAVAEPSSVESGRSANSRRQ